MSSIHTCNTQSRSCTQAVKLLLSLFYEKSFCSISDRDKQYCPMNWSLIFYYKYKAENYHLYNEIKLEPDILFWWIIHICGG